MDLGLSLSLDNMYSDALWLSPVIAFSIVRNVIPHAWPLLNACIECQQVVDNTLVFM